MWSVEREGKDNPQQNQNHRTKAKFSFWWHRYYCTLQKCIYHFFLQQMIQLIYIHSSLTQWFMLPSWPQLLICTNSNSFFHHGVLSQNVVFHKPLFYRMLVCTMWFHYYSSQHPNFFTMYTRVNKIPSAWNFLSPKPEVTCGTVAIIIRVVLLSPYLRIRAISLSFIHHNQSHCVYINRRRQYICLIWN